MKAFPGAHYSIGYKNTAVPALLINDNSITSTLMQYILKETRTNFFFHSLQILRYSNLNNWHFNTLGQKLQY